MNALAQTHKASSQRLSQRSRRDSPVLRGDHWLQAGGHLGRRTDLFGKVRTYAHCFTGDAPPGFFQFADADDAAEFGPELQPSGFRHLAFKVDQPTQDAIQQRLEAAGYFESGQAYPLNHGYCWSLYCFDPSGLLMEWTVDHEDVEQINADKAASAHDDLRKWLGGDHTPNNEQFHR